MKYPLLFSPIKINQLRLRNRIIMPSMVTCHAAINGEVTDKLIQYHAERAAGGCGLNMLEATYVELAGNSYTRGIGASDDFMLPGLRRLTAAVHAHDGKIGIQLQHGGRTAYPPSSQHPIALVSYIPDLTPYDESRVMDKEEIQRVIQAYAQAAERAVKAGFDIIELHGAHGYLINQFMSPHTNRRMDDYGGSFTNRMRFPLEVLQAVRAVTGPNYPLLFRFSVEEFVPDGINLAMAQNIATLLVDNGIDALDVSVGIAESSEYTIPPSAIAPGWNADRALAIKQAINNRVPVAVVGRINTGPLAENILADGKADIIAMGRALLADPHLPNKLAMGLDAEVLPCIACNEACVGAFARKRPVSCAVNPRAGYEGRYPLLKSNTPKNIVVVGGGPAGMQTALSAAERGHIVSLLEKEKCLGGLINVAVRPPHKQSFLPLVRYYEQALHRAGVRVLLEHTATVDSILSFKPDMTLICTGSEAIQPQFCATAPTLSAEEVLNGAQTGQRVLIIGGGLVGTETAEFLAAQDSSKQVTVLEQRDDIALDMETRTRKVMLPRLNALKIQCLLKTEVAEITPQGLVRVRDCFHQERWLEPYDSLVIAVGYRSKQALYQQLHQKAMPCLPLGDCVKPGKIMDAIEQGFRAAYQL